MAKPPTMSPPTANLAERDALLATKLHVPRPRPGFVLRPRLLERLQEGMEQQVVLVCTPAGFGKTSLLADWARRDRRPVAWLSLDEADNDPARFWRHLVAALEGVRPGVAERVTPLLGPPVPSSFEGLVAAVITSWPPSPTCPPSPTAAPTRGSPPDRPGRRAGGSTSRRPPSGTTPTPTARPSGTSPGGWPACSSSTTTRRRPSGCPAATAWTTSR
jgi:hypothetical protein